MSRKILFVSSNFSLGGLETHLITYFKFLKEFDFRLFFLTHINDNIYMGNIPSELNLYVDKLFVVNSTNEFYTDVRNFYDETLKIIRYYSVDLVHLHPFESIFGGYLAAFECSVPVAVTLHGKASLSLFDEISTFFLENVILNNSLIFSVNEKLYRELLHGHTNNLFYLPNPVDNDCFKTVKEVQRDNYVLIVSRLDSDKVEGIKCALSVLAEQSGKFGFKVKVVGEGNSKSELEKVFSDDNIEFMGFRASNEVGSLMSKALAVGGMGRVVLEGLFVGVPVFLIGYDGIKGFVTEDLYDAAKVANFNGTNIGNIDKEQFVEDLRRVVEGDKNVGNIRNVRKKAISEFSAQNVVSKYVQVIRSFDDAFLKKAGTEERYLRDSVTFYKSILDEKISLEHYRRDVTHLRNEIIEWKEKYEKCDLERKRLEKGAVENRKLINKYSSENKALQRQVEDLRKMLQNIYDSNFWKVAKTYYALRDNVPPFNLIYRAIFYGKNRRRERISSSSDLHEKKLSEILDRFNGDVIFILPPVVDWNIPLFQRPQHLARKIAEHGALYFFCTPNSKYDNVDGFLEISKNCFVTNRFDLVDRVSLSGVKKVYDMYSTDNNTNWKFVEDRLEGEGNILLYQYIDEISSEISGIKIPRSVLRKHYNILREEKCVVVASATKLLKEVQKYRKENYKLITNGVEIEHFSRSFTPDEYPESIKIILGRKRPIIGYFGALASWFDYELIIELAGKRKDLEILLIGVDYDGSVKRYNLDAYENINLIGPVAYEDLPRYAAAFNVAVIPFLVNEITESTSPIKLFEYMAMKKPIVTTNLPECKKYDPVLVAKDREEFIEKIDVALKLVNDEDYLNSLYREAVKNSWDAKAKEILELVMNSKRHL